MKPLIEKKSGETLVRLDPDGPGVAVSSGQVSLLLKCCSQEWRVGEQSDDACPTCSLPLHPAWVGNTRWESDCLAYLATFHADPISSAVWGSAALEAVLAETSDGLPALAAPNVLSFWHLKYFEDLGEGKFYLVYDLSCHNVGVRVSMKAAADPFGDKGSVLRSYVAQLRLACCGLIATGIPPSCSSCRNYLWDSYDSSNNTRIVIDPALFPNGRAGVSASAETNISTLTAWADYWGCNPLESVLAASSLQEWLSEESGIFYSGYSPSEVDFYGLSSLGPLRTSIGSAWR